VVAFNRRAKLAVLHGQQRRPAVVLRVPLAVAAVAQV
jgi:hypothetical protein